MLSVALVGLAGGLAAACLRVLAAQSFGPICAARCSQGAGAVVRNLDRLETAADHAPDQRCHPGYEAVMMLLRVMVRVPLLLIGSLILAVITSPQLALILCGADPVVLVADLDHQQDFPNVRRGSATIGQLNTVMPGKPVGVRVIKAFARADHERDASTRQR